MIIKVKNSGYKRYVQTFADYFLSSLDELQAMHDVLHLSGLGGFSETIYWSSSEYDPDQSYYFNFNANYSDWDSKTQFFYVRACRSFIGTTTDYPLRSMGPAGGYVFAYDVPNGLVLEAAPSDQSTGQVWSDINDDEIGTTGTAIGTGKQNTNNIIAQSDGGDTAALLCFNLNIIR